MSSILSVSQLTILKTKRGFSLPLCEEQKIKSSLSVALGEKRSDRKWFLTANKLWCYDQRNPGEMNMDSDKHENVRGEYYLLPTLIG